MRSLIVAILAMVPPSFQDASRRFSEMNRGLVDSLSLAPKPCNDRDLGS